MAQLHIGTEEGVDRYATKAHVAYAVVNLEEWCVRLNAQGIQLLESVPIPGYERFECRVHLVIVLNLSSQSARINETDHILN